MAGTSEDGLPLLDTEGSGPGYNEDGTPTLPEDDQGNVITPSNQAPASSATASTATPTQPVAFSTTRNIGGFVADCTISEEHTDEITITDHPVEQGANISDHAYIDPVKVVIRVGYSNSSTNAGGDSTYVRTQYQNFLTLQKSRQPFDIITGKRKYSNMLIQSLATTTDASTENSLVLTVTCREVLIATVSTTTVPAADQHATPQQTAPVTSGGSVTPTPANPQPTITTSSTPKSTIV